MKFFIIHNQKGKILSTGFCSNRDFNLQAQKDEFVIEGRANDITQKVVEGKVVDKTPEEIKAEKPKSIEMSFEKQKANITNEQLQIILNRIVALEVKHSQKEI